MKWMVASDIHGSEYYCRQLINAFDNEKADKLLLLGDLLYHGPRNDLPKDYNPKAVINILNEYKTKILCVRGNCDAEVDQMVLDFPIMADYAIVNIRDSIIYATHGHIHNTSNMPPLTDGDILLHGHTHIPACEKVGEIIYMNPGSTSIPKEGSHHGYMIIEDGTFIWKDFDGNIIMNYEEGRENE